MMIWIASYPKSGNTWVRALLSSYYFSKNGEFNFNLLSNIDSFPSPRFFSQYDDLFSKPEETSKYWISQQNKINQKKEYIFLKTHSALCSVKGNNFTDKKNSLGSIYIIRDPRNVISSLAHHYQMTKDEALKFMLDKNRAIVSRENNRYTGFQPLFSWEFNVSSWVNNKLFPVLIVRYEDLQKETFATFKNIVNFINEITKSKKSLDNEKIKNCIKSTKFENMQKLEQEKGFAEAVTKNNSNEKIKFFNLGEKNNYKNLLDKNLIQEMNDKFRPFLIKYKYE